MPDEKLPPGPSGRWLPTLRIVRNPQAAFRYWTEKFGDPCLIHALNGPIVFTGREDLIRIIFGPDSTGFSPFAVETARPILGAHSMLLLDGLEHKRERRLIAPMFHGDRMKAYATAMRDVAREQFTRYQPKQIIEVSPLMTNISLEIIVRTTFGGTSRTQVDEMLDAARQVISRCHPLLLFSKKMQFPFAGISLWDRYRKAKRRLDKVFDNELDLRQATGYHGDDILSLLSNSHYEDGQAIDRQHIREELLTFLFAGHETTALAMTWAFYHLHSHPETLQRLQQELAGTDDNEPMQLTQLPYLKAVIQESLRLHPIVTEVLRLLNKPLPFGEFHLPAGVALGAVSPLAHYNESVYPEPERFNPDRFLKRSYSPFEYFPFGGGHRRCIGAAFASFEMAIVLGTLLKHHRFDLLETGTVTQVRRSVTMGPSRKIRVRCIG